VTKDEVLDLALEVMQIKSTLSAFGPDEDVTFTQDTWAKLHAAMSAVVTQPAPVQEPVAWINVEKRTFEWNGPVLWNTPTVAVLDKIPLYSTPPAAQRQWVGLDDDDISALGLSIAKAKALESLLKRRNT